MYASVQDYRGIWGHAPPGNVRGSEIASEAIVGQKQYVLHPILAVHVCICMLSQLTLNFDKRRY